MVVGADGQRSTTRDQVFPNEAELKYLGLYTSYVTISKGRNDSDWARWYLATKSRNILLRPDNQGTTRASLNFLSPDREFGVLSQQEKKALLEKVFADAGWESERILDEIKKSGDVYLDSVTQVRMLHWSKGRVALVGDAAYCPTPLSGKGTALAMIGAYILANELKAKGDHAAASKAYEDRLRDYVEKVQNLPAWFIKLAYPSSELGVYLINKLESVIASKVFQTIAGLFNSESNDEDDFKLPDYRS